ncbi:hypothetical protein [Mediterraneibacter gnavus]|uniref:hypothetical protein n=1 Tax=Mediterraneibacter gnavus TaxID=33038 RepID=UPI00232CFB56|nr:hypothetical protein [Mediterraneibacter gnavus]MDB8711635.1 hypothetical protein [Mediterraneibacter gnavus]MDB8714645.1 hypothetical protein [Mediterraneibacter gnavus]
MKKKIVAMLLVGAMTLSITACSGGAEPFKNNETKTESTTEKKEPLDLTGTWKSEEVEGSYQEATISDSVIEINWVSDGGNTKSLYWAGTYVAPTESTDKYSWISENDKEKTGTALLASSDDTKDFTYKDGVISYEASAMGTTKKVELTKE